MTRHSRGDTVRLYLDIISAGAGVISQSPTIAIQRLSDGKWFQASDGTWQSTIVENDMTQTDVTNLPGRYHFDFDQSLDTAEGSVWYIAKKSNIGVATLEYEDLVFGPLAAATGPELCSVQGTILSGQGEPVLNALVRATLIPVLKDALGRAYQADRVLSTYTDENGDFDIPLVREGTYRLEIDAVGYDRKITVPNQASALFTDL